MILKYAETRPGGHIDEPIYAGDVGYDLAACETVEIAPGQMVDVPIGVAIELPVGKWGEITHRSSGPRKMGIEVLKGVIDNGYRGELFALCHNLTGQSIRIRTGDRVAQLILYDIERPQVQKVIYAQLSDSDRGSNGFGSSGTGKA